jgi:hypothetical protein
MIRKSISIGCFTTLVATVVYVNLRLNRFGEIAHQSGFRVEPLTLSDMVSDPIYLSIAVVTFALSFLLNFSIPPATMKALLSGRTGCSKKTVHPLPFDRSRGWRRTPK